MTNISNISWTYAHALKKDFTYDNRINTAYNSKVSTSELKRIILDVCKDCAKTPAFNKFEVTLNSFKNNTSVITFVYNSFLKGSGLGTI